MPENIQYNNCPSCGSEAIQFFIVCKDHLVSGETFELWQCNNCNLRFTQNAPSEKEIGRYYQSEDYMSHAIGGKGLFNNMYQLARKYSVWWRCRLVLQTSKKHDGNILDIGSGVGAFAGGIKKNGWNTTAIEPDADARLSALKQYGIEAQPMSDLYGFADKSFDVITLWHVLEHVHDLHGYMKEITRLLKKEGFLIIAVPNFLSTDARHYKPFWAAYDVPRHLYHFSPGAMEKLTRIHGFKIIRKRLFWLDAYFASLLSEEHKHGRKKWIVAAWYGLISNLKAFTNKDRGSAITYILQKDEL